MRFTDEITLSGNVLGRISLYRCLGDSENPIYIRGWLAHRHEKIGKIILKVDGQETEECILTELKNWNSPPLPVPDCTRYGMEARIENPGGKPLSLLITTCSGACETMTIDVEPRNVFRLPPLWCDFDQPLTLPSLPPGRGGPAETLGKVCFVMTVSEDAPGRGEEYFVQCAALLSRSGFDVTFMLAIPFQSPDRAAFKWRLRLKESGIPFEMVTPRWPRKEGRWRQLSLDLFHRLKSQEFDWIHFHDSCGMGYYSMFAARQGLAFRESTLCLHLLGPALWLLESKGEYPDGPEYLERDVMERRSAELADVVLVPDTSIVAWLCENYWAMADRSYSLPEPSALGASLSEFHEHAKEYRTRRGVAGSGTGLQISTPSSHDCRLGKEEYSLLLPAGVTLPAEQFSMLEECLKNREIRILNFCPADPENGLSCCVPLHLDPVCGAYLKGSLGCGAVVHRSVLENMGEPDTLSRAGIQEFLLRCAACGYDSDVLPFADGTGICEGNAFTDGEDGERARQGRIAIIQEGMPAWQRHFLEVVGCFVSRASEDE